MTSMLIAFNFSVSMSADFGGLNRESNEKFEQPFVDASPDQQKRPLDRVAYPEQVAKEDHAWMRFFNEFRDLTMSGFFSSKDQKVCAVVKERMENGYRV